MGISSPRSGPGGAAQDVPNQSSSARSTAVTPHAGGWWWRRGLSSYRPVTVPRHCDHLVPHSEMVDQASAVLYRNPCDARGIIGVLSFD